MKNYYLGHIDNANPLKLEKVSVGEPCVKCDILNICGGRCLYANVTRRWGGEAYQLVCGTVRNLVEAITEELPRIRQIIESGKMTLRDFEFMKFNGCEIIP